MLEAGVRGGRSSVSRAFFDRIAREGAMVAFDREELAVVCRQMARWGIAPGAWVLEVGCGSGRLTALLAERAGARGRVVAVDLSLGMLACARRRGRGPWLAAAAERLPLKAAIFHCAIWFQVLPHMADRSAAFAETARVLVSRGILWIAHAVPRAQVNALHRSLGPPVDTHLLPEPGVLLAEARAAGLRPRHLEDGPRRGFLMGLERH